MAPTLAVLLLISMVIFTSWVTSLSGNHYPPLYQSAEAYWQWLFHGHVGLHNYLSHTHQAAETYWRWLEPEMMKQVGDENEMGDPDVDAKAKEFIKKQHVHFRWEIRRDGDPDVDSKAQEFIKKHHNHFKREMLNDFVMKMAEGKPVGRKKQVRRPGDPDVDAKAQKFIKNQHDHFRREMMLSCDETCQGEAKDNKSFNMVCN